MKFIVANRANAGLCVLQAQSLTANFILSLCAPWKCSNNNTSDLKHWYKLNTQPFWIFKIRWINCGQKSFVYMWTTSFVSCMLFDKCRFSGSFTFAVTLLYFILGITLLYAILGVPLLNVIFGVTSACYPWRDFPVCHPWFRSNCWDFYTISSIKPSRTNIRNFKNVKLKN